MQNLLNFIETSTDKTALMVAIFVLKSNRTLSHTEYVAINNAIYTRKQSLGL
jgi:hypothetical protein